MKDFIITTDSSCDLPMTYCEELDVIPFPMRYVSEGVERLNLMEHAETVAFYDRMRAGEQPTTTQINIYEFQSFWEPMLERGLPILHISLGAAISGTCRNAQTAAELLREIHPNADIRIVNSANASTGVGLLVVMAATMRREGHDIAETAEKLGDTAHSVNSIYTTGELKYLCAGGRLSRIGAIVGGVLNINPILDLDYEGHLKIRERARGRKQAEKRLVEIVEELVVEPEKQTLFISNADCQERAERMAKLIVGECGFKDYFVSDIGPTVGSHTGPGLISAFFVGKKRTGSAV